jgi:DNA-binding HxlR family transcriptional regulator
MTSNDARAISPTGLRADRDQWLAAGSCSLERALTLVGKRSTMLLLREAFFGGRRFDDLARRAGITDAIAAKRLRELVDDGLLVTQPYREPGHRTRHEYILTERGLGLFPVIVSLIQWGDTLQHGEQGPIKLSHANCGEPLEHPVRCRAGHPVSVPDTVASISGTNPPNRVGTGRAQRSRQHPARP